MLRTLVAHPPSRSVRRLVRAGRPHAVVARSGSTPPSCKGTRRVLRTCKAIGEIDMATAPKLMDDLRETIDASDEALVSVDCSDVTFMDSSGFHVLVDATGYAARRGHTLVIRDMSPSCRRLIRLCNVDHELCVEQAPPRTPAAVALVDAALYPATA